MATRDFFATLAGFDPLIITDAALMTYYNDLFAALGVNPPDDALVVANRLVRDLASWRSACPQLARPVQKTPVSRLGTPYVAAVVFFDSSMSNVFVSGAGANPVTYLSPAQLAELMAGDTQYVDSDGVGVCGCDIVHSFDVYAVMPSDKTGECSVAGVRRVSSRAVPVDTYIAVDLDSRFASALILGQSRLTASLSTQLRICKGLLSNGVHSVLPDSGMAVYEIEKSLQAKDEEIAQLKTALEAKAVVTSNPVTAYVDGLVKQRLSLQGFENI